MSDDLKDILSNQHPEIDQETLMLYLQGKLTPDQKHEVEKQLMQGDFEEEAMEGLNEFKDKEQIQYTVEALNRDLKKTEQKEKTPGKDETAGSDLIVVSVVIVLLLVIVSYVVIKKLIHN